MWRPRLPWDRSLEGPGGCAHVRANETGGQGRAEGWDGRDTRLSQGPPWSSPLRAPCLLSSSLVPAAPRAPSAGTCWSSACFTQGCWGSSLSRAGEKQPSVRSLPVCGWEGKQGPVPLPSGQKLHPQRRGGRMDVPTREEGPRKLEGTATACVLWGQVGVTPRPRGRQAGRDPAARGPGVWGASRARGAGRAWAARSPGTGLAPLGWGKPRAPARPVGTTPARAHSLPRAPGAFRGGTLQRSGCGAATPVPLRSRPGRAPAALRGTRVLSVRC